MGNISVCVGGDWWNDDKHRLSVISSRLCDCPYHEKLRWDAECDRRDNLEANDDTE